MKGRSSRELFLVALIAIAVTAGFVAQVNGRCDHAYAVKSAALETLTQDMRHEPDIGALVLLKRQTARILSQIDVSSSISSEVALYERLMDLGERAGVRIDRVDPVKTESRDHNNGEFGSYGANIEAVGSYESFVQFINAIETNIGYSSIIRFALAPVSTFGEDLVHGSVETRHLRMDEDTLELVASVNAEEE